jgi:hypothetical protein
LNYFCFFGFQQKLLPWALALYLMFAALHAVFPIALQRWRPATELPNSSTLLGFSEHLPALPAVMPFLLLIIASLELPTRQPCNSRFPRWLTLIRQAPTCGWCAAESRYLL